MPGAQNGLSSGLFFRIFLNLIIIVKSANIGAHFTDGYVRSTKMCMLKCIDEWAVLLID